MSTIGKGMVSQEGTAQSDGCDGDGAVEEGDLFGDSAVGGAGRRGGGGGSATGGGRGRGGRARARGRGRRWTLRLLQFQGRLLVRGSAIRLETRRGGGLEGRVGAHAGKVGIGSARAGRQ